MKYKTIIIFVMLLVFASTMASALIAPSIDFGQTTAPVTASSTINITNDELVNITVNNITINNLELGSSNINTAQIIITPALALPQNITPNNNLSIDFDIVSTTALFDYGYYTGNYSVGYFNGTTNLSGTNIASVLVVAPESDIEVTGISANPSPIYDNVLEQFTIQVRNNGPNSFLGSPLDPILTVDFGDGSAPFTQSITQGVANGQTIDLTIVPTHTYTSTGTYTVTATITYGIAYHSDSNLTNNVGTQNFTVSNLPVVDITMPNDFVFNLYRGESDTETEILTNSGNQDVNVTLSHSTPGVSSSLNPNGLVTVLTSGSENINLTFSNIVVNPGVYTGTVYGDYIDALGNPIQETSNITLNVLNYLPTISASQTQVIENNYFSASFTDDDGDNDPVSVNIVNNGCSSWATVTSSSISGTAPSLGGASSQTCSVTFELDDGFDTVNRTIQFTILEDLPYLSVNSLTFDGGRDSFHTEYITITNTGVQDLSNIDIQLQGVSSSYNADLGTYSTNLLVGASMNVALEIFIPEDMDSGLEDIGNIYVSADGNPGLSTSDTSDIFIDAESFLDIINVEIDIDGEEDDHENDVDENETFIIYQNDIVEIEVTLENLYNTNNYDIEDVYFEIESSDGDFNIEITSDEINVIEDGEDEKVDVRFTINVDNSVDRGDISTITIKAYGEDSEENFDHYDEFEFNLEFEKEDDKLTITDIYTIPETITCEDTSFTLYIELTNEGYDDQDNVFVNIDSDYDAFWLDEDSSEIDNFDEGDREVFSFVVPINSRLTEGYHTIDVSAYRGSSYSYLEDVETVWINMNNPGCASSAISGSSGSSSSGSSGSSSSGASSGSEEGSSSSNSGESVLSPSSSGSIISVGPTIEAWITSTSKRFKLSDGIKIALWALVGAVVIALIVLSIVAIVRRN